MKVVVGWLIWLKCRFVDRDEGAAVHILGKAKIKLGIDTSNAVDS